MLTILKKYKQLLIGITIGGVLFTFAPALAETIANELRIYKNPYPVVVNGTTQDVDAYNINDYTYVKLSDLGKCFGDIKVSFNQTDSQIEITSTSPGGQTGTPGTVNNKPKSTPDGITMIDEWQGKYYIGFSYIDNKVKEKGYRFISDFKTDIWQLSKDGVVILDNVPTTMVYGGDSVEYNYYVNTIMPLVK